MGRCPGLAPSVRFNPLSPRHSKQALGGRNLPGIARSGCAEGCLWLPAGLACRQHFDSRQVPVSHTTAILKKIPRWSRSFTCIATDTNRAPGLVGINDVDAVGNRFAELLVRRFISEFSG